MARRRGIPKRRINPDPKYKSIKLAKFVNRMMKDGKKKQEMQNIGLRRIRII